MEIRVNIHNSFHSPIVQVENNITIACHQYYYLKKYALNLIYSCLRDLVALKAK